MILSNQFTTNYIVVFLCNVFPGLDWDEIPMQQFRIGQGFTSQIPLQLGKHPDHSWDPWIEQSSVTAPSNGGFITCVCKQRKQVVKVMSVRFCRDDCGVRQGLPKRERGGRLQAIISNTSFRRNVRKGVVQGKTLL